MSESRLSSEWIDRPAEGLNLRPSRLADQFLPGEATLLVFLRHLG